MVGLPEDEGKERAKRLVEAQCLKVESVAIATTRLSDALRLLIGCVSVWILAHAVGVFL